MPDIRAVIERDYGSPFNGIAVVIYQRAEHGTPGYVYTTNEHGQIMPSVQVDPNQTLFERPGPTLRIPDDAARALLDGLLEHFRGGTDTREAAAALAVERGRVDKLLDTVTTLALRGGQ